MMTDIDFIFFDAGGGHRSAATALKSVIDSQNRHWNIRLVNLQEILHDLDVFRKVTGIRLEDLYNEALARGWTLGSAYGIWVNNAVIRMNHGSMVHLLKKHWETTRPAMVVSLVPNFNRELHESLAAALPQTPFVTILTDFADFPLAFLDGAPAAVPGVRHAEGRPASRRTGASAGARLRNLRHDPAAQVLRTADRRPRGGADQLELDPGGGGGAAHRAEVLFGGQGSGVMLEIARRLPETQLIFICGRNQKLAEELRAHAGVAPRLIEGFTGEIPYFMHLSDFFIGKPGPGSISEAVAMRLPVIVERNAWTLAQER